MIVYHYNRDSKQYEGQSEAAISPLDFLKFGSFVPLIPASSTVIAPDFSTIPANPVGWIDLFWKDEKWTMGNKPDVYGRVTNKIAKNFLGQGWLAVETRQPGAEGFWYILLNPSTMKYTVVHEFDEEYFSIEFDSYDEAVYEIDILEEKRKAPTDTTEPPITTEEEEESRKRWEAYAKEQRDAIFELEEKIEDLRQNKESWFEEEKKKIEEYEAGMNQLIDRDFKAQEEYYFAKAMYITQLFLEKINQKKEEIVKAISQGLPIAASVATENFDIYSPSPAPTQEKKSWTIPMIAAGILGGMMLFEEE